MAEEQKNSSAETVDAAASAAHTVKGAIKAGKAISGAAKGAAAAGPYGAVAGAVWAGRKHIGKIIAVIAILLLLPVLFLLMLPGLIFGGLVNAFSPADPDTPILNSETAIVENANDITFTINAILGEALDDVIARIEEDFASSGADQMEIKNPFALTGQAQQQVLAAHIAVAQLGRTLLGQPQGGLGPLGKSGFAHVFTSFAPSPKEEPPLPFDGLHPLCHAPFLLFCAGAGRYAARHPAPGLGSRPPPCEIERICPWKNTPPSGGWILFFPTVKKYTHSRRILALHF